MHWSGAFQQPCASSAHPLDRALVLAHRSEKHAPRAILLCDLVVEVPGESFSQKVSFALTFLPLFLSLGGPFVRVVYVIM